MEAQDDILSMLRKTEKGWGEVGEHAQPFINPELKTYILHLT